MEPIAASWQMQGYGWVSQDHVPYSGDLGEVGAQFLPAPTGRQGKRRMSCKGKGMTLVDKEMKKDME